MVVLFCQAAQAGRFLRGAYLAGMAGEGFFFLGSDAVASAGTWESDPILAADMATRHAVLKGFFGLVPSNGAGTPEYAAFRERYERFASRVLPTLADAGTCDPTAIRSVSPSWNATDADGRSLWIQSAVDGSGDEVCVAPANPAAENSYSPFAYDAVYAVARALHVLIERRSGEGSDASSSIDGTALIAALLRDVSFDGITGRVEFHAGDFEGDASTDGDAATRTDRQLIGRGGAESVDAGMDAPPSARRLQADATQYRGDRRVGVSYSVLNYQGDIGLVRVGAWTPCATDEPACAFARRWTTAPDAVLVYSTADGELPIGIQRLYCALQVQCGRLAALSTALLPSTSRLSHFLTRFPSPIPRNPGPPSGGLRLLRRGWLPHSPVLNALWLLAA